jgi:hypothetical protein
MTICIAAICQSGKSIVVAADRMYTSPPPLNVEFESDEPKIEAFAPGIVVLPAGSTAIVTEILDAAKAKLQGKTSPAVPEAAEALRLAYGAVRLEKAEEQFALPLAGQDFYNLRTTKGLTLAQYLQPQPGIYQAIVGQMSQYNLGTELLVAGIDARGAKIAAIGHPGMLYWLDKLGYGAVGSGAIHALSTLNLSGQTRARDLYETMYWVYSAKEAAQVAPGVGRVTDLAVVEQGSIRNTDKAVLDELMQMRSKAKALAPPNLGGLKTAYDNLGKR